MPTVICFNVKLLFVSCDEAYQKEILNVIAPMFREIICVNAHKDAINAIANDKQNSIDLILTDIDTDGSYTFDMLSVIRTIRPKILAIIMTPLAFNAIFKQIGKIDKRNDYIADPLNIDEFINTVKDDLNKLDAIRQEDKAENVLKQYKIAMDEVAQSITVDLNGKIIDVNKFLERIFDYKRKEIIGKYIDIILPEELNKGLQKKLWKTLKSKKLWKGQLVSKKASGELIYGEVTAIPMLDLWGNIMEYMFIRHDTTELIKESAAAKKYAKTKDEFLANMSHEIRTPLNGIIGYAQLLKKIDLPENAADYIDIIFRSGSQLLDIINQILDLSKIQSGFFTLAPEWSSLFDELESVLKMFLYASKEKHINFYFDIDQSIPKQVLCDSLRLKQVLVNLIGNAFKFTYSGVWVKISLIKLDQDKADILFSVKDDGIGIPKDKLQSIFQPFVQERASTAKKYGGTGLGLAITSEILAMMGSSVALNSKVGQGSEFNFTLTLEYKDIDKDKVDKEQNVESEILKFDAKVLVAEDNEINQLVVTDTLELYGVKTLCVDNGKAAVEAYQKDDSFAIIFMDLDMPEMDGIEATQAILAYERANSIAHTPIIALTANVISGEKQKCLDAGMDDYLSKPFRLNEMESILKRYMPHKTQTTANLNKKFEYDIDKTAKTIGVKAVKIIPYINNFIAMAQTDIPKMQEALNAKQYANLASMAHKLKGTSGLLQLEKLFLLFGEIERAVKQEITNFNYDDALNSLKEEIIIVSNFAMQNSN